MKKKLPFRSVHSNPKYVPEIEDIRDELFCVLFSRTANATQSYRDSHWSPKEVEDFAIGSDQRKADLINVSRTMGFRHKNNPTLKARIAWLYYKNKRKVIEKSKDGIVNLCLKRASSDITDVLKWETGDDGEPIMALVDSEYVDGQCIDEVSITPSAFGNKIRVKMPDREKAAKLVAELEGMIIKQAEIYDSPDSLQDKASSEAYQKRLKMIREKKAPKNAEKTDPGGKA